MNEVLGKLVAAATFAFWCSVCAAETVKPGTVVYTTGYETAEEVKGWQQSANWKIEEGAGTKGSRALVWTNSDPFNYKVAGFKIPKVKYGMKLEADFKVKVDSLSGAKLGCTICWNDRTGKWLGGAGGTVVKWGNSKLKPDADGWYHMKIRTRHLPGKAGASYLQLYAHRGGVGRIRFDDIRIKVVDIKSIGGIESMATSAYRNIAAGGGLKVAAGFELPGDLYESGKAIVTLSYFGADGSLRTKPMQVENMDRAIASLDVSELAPGRHPISVNLKGSDGRDFGARQLMFDRVSKLPSRRVSFDSHKRAIVDGKPFFPLGMYWSEKTLSYTNSLERYASGPFNCLQTYEKSMTPEILDRYWAHGLRVVASVKDVYIPCDDGRRIGFTPPSVKTRTDETNYVRAVVERCRNHPALLAWYICDEIPREYHDRLADRYSLMKDIDPDHPTFVCICDAHSARPFMDSTDVIGSDTYPVPGTDAKGRVLPPKFGRVWAAGESAQTVKKGMFGFLPQWQVPQAFAWKWDFPKKPELRFPTVNELRNMVWQQIAVGANGILLYSYGQMIHRPKFDENFAASCKVAAEVRDLIPVLLLDPGPAVTAKPNRVLVRTWKDGATVYALVVNTHPEKRTGEVRLAGDWKTCETVYGSGASLKNGILVLDMSSMGAVIVRMKQGAR